MSKKEQYINSGKNKGGDTLEMHRTSIEEHDYCCALCIVRTSQEFCSKPLKKFEHMPRDRMTVILEHL